MTEITQLHGSAHDRTQRLLPWYNNGTLDDEEVALVEAHLAECEECRDACRSDMLLSRQIAELPLDTDHGWAVLGDKLDGDKLPATSNVAFFKRRVPVSWMVGGQAAAAALVIGILTSLPSAPPRTYHALASAPVTASGNVVVVFKPETSEATMRAALLEAGARVVDGPNVSGAYVLQVPSSARMAALKLLKGKPQVVVAEPIGSGPST